jgi:DNA-binding response OmpR family regulator
VAGYRFTLAEDDEAGLFLLYHAISLTSPGSSIASFTNAEDALHHILNTGSDFLITDHAVGRMSGTDLIRELRQRGIQIPIIMISGHPRAEEEALLAGATEFLKKSDDTRYLEERVRSLMSKGQARW